LGEGSVILKAKYRNCTEIIASVLEATKGGAGKTRIIFTAYLSEQLNEYLKELLYKGLLRYDFLAQTYNMTPNGSKFLELYAELEKVD
jgi:predicted transcriptional regulator